MKSSLLITVFLAGAFFLSSHSETIDSFYAKYKPLEKAKLEMQKEWVRKLVGDMIPKGDIKKHIQDATKLKIVILGEEQVEEQELTALKKGLKKEGMDQLITVKSEDEKFDFLIKKINDNEYHIFYLLIDDGDLIFLSLKGDWPIEKLLSGRQC